MTWAGNVVMTGVMEHCDDKCHGTLCLQGSWSIVMRGVLEHCDDRRHGAL